MPDKKSSVSNFFTDLMESFVLAMACSLVVYSTVAIPNIVEGSSMEPNFKNNELLLTNKASEWLGNTSVGQAWGLDYQRGDVIVFTTQGLNLIKRVIAVGGDVVRLHDGKVYVNGLELKESYLPEGTETFAYSGNISFIEDDQVKRVPADSYFVLGDNRGNSKDSRFTDVGFVPRDTVKGKVMLIYWPLSNFNLIGQGNYSVSVATDNN
jgi:signal peptidase I